MEKAEVLVQGLSGAFWNQILKQRYDLPVEDEGVQVVGIGLRSCEGIAEYGETLHGEGAEYLIEGGGSHGRKSSKASTNSSKASTCGTWPQFRRRRHAAPRQLAVS
jgi:hypothetical protein